MAAKESTTKRKSPGGNHKDSLATKKHKHGNESENENENDGGEARELSSSAQKRLVRKERQATRRHAESVTEAKALWNKLRMKTNTKEDTQKLMEKVMDLIRGKVREIALQHDASRVVQAAIQFGSDAQRKEILEEICRSEGSLGEMAKIQYAHFVSLKFIKYCARDEASVKLIVKSFKGEMPKLAVHGVGARVVESIFLNLPSKLTAPLKQEFYGPHFSLFAKDLTSAPSLKSNIENAKTETQKKSAIDFVQAIINKGMTKSFYGFTYFQQLFAEYVEVADPSEIRSISSSVADHSIHLLSTRVGTRVVAACASYGTPKDRKRSCKSLKGYTSSSLLHRDAYLALLRLVQVTDDTVSIQKSVLNEILTKPKEGNDEENGAKNGLLELALSDTGSKLFLMLLVEDDESRMKYFDPYERSILEPVATIRENGKDVPTSKKDPDTRRRELLKHIRDALLETCTDHAGDLLRSLPGSRVLKEVYASAPSQKLADAVAETCATSMDEVFEDPIAHRSVKSLVLCDSESDEKAACVSRALVDKLGKRLPDVARSNRGAFVAAALFRVPGVKDEVKKAFGANKKKIEAKSKQKGTTTAGYAALLKELSN
ncbi:unnamed protein product [Pseudo-nitzschia multistriata]|uniref:PUM-HD domain-containing protein n=1 Tax=Pseudo-nitzschia multistriata TaxID=183589 RepID=A0A448Z1A3_9STRA|nr:unnamed protein product [Pseudo-nitzschia multistriata]